MTVRGWPPATRAALLLRRYLPVEQTQADLSPTAAIVTPGADDLPRLKAARDHLDRLIRSMEPRR